MATDSRRGRTLLVLSAAALAWCLDACVGAGPSLPIYTLAPGGSGPSAAASAPSPASLTIGAGSPSTPAGAGVPTSTLPPTKSPPAWGPTVITVPRTSSKGVMFVAPRNGTYEFRYLSGAYSTYATSKAPAEVATWLASVCIFRGRPNWQGENLNVASAWLVIGWGGQYYFSQAAARAAAVGQSLDGALSAGDQLTLVAVDKQSQYFDNSGTDVKIEVSLLP